VLPPIWITDTWSAAARRAALHEAADAAVLHRDEAVPARTRFLLLQPAPVHPGVSSSKPK
jgi:hypothetical protein